MQPYCKLAAMSNYCVMILEPFTSWKLSPAQLARKTKHGVPYDKIKQMKQKIEDIPIDFVCGNLPAKFKPETTSLEDLKVSRNSSGDVAQQSYPSGSQPYANGHASGFSARPRCSSKSDDFQSLMSCFPDLSVDDLYLPYLKNKYNMEMTMNDILDGKSDSLGGDSDNQFEINLDAEAARQLENSFGSVRGGLNFPGAQSFKIPERVAKLLHFYWKSDIQEKLSEAEVKRLLESEAPSAAKVAAKPAQAAAESNLQGFPEEESGESEARPISPEEIQLLKQKRSESYQKAARAYKAKQGGVAAYYSEEGRNLTEQIAVLEEQLRYNNFVEANQGKNNHSIDLHGLTVQEALQQLEWFIDEKRNALRYSKQLERMKLEVITGRGTKTRAKIKPAVVAYFKRNELQFSEANAGSFDIVIRKRFDNNNTVIL